MSQSTSQWYRHWLLQRFNLLQCSFTRDGKILTSQDRATWVDCVILHAIMLNDLGFARSTTNVNVRRWIKTIMRTDTLDVMRVYKAADELLLRSFEDDSISTETFKQSLPPDGRKILRPVWTSLMWFFKTTSSTADFRRLHQWLAFPSRINLKGWEDEEALTAYVTTDQDLRNVSFRYVSAMNHIIRYWLSDFRVTGKPSHGNGAVAEEIAKDQRSLVRKYKCVATDSILNYAAAQSGLNLDDYVPGGDICFQPYTSQQRRTSRLQSVPKSALKKRLICMEPAGLQYWQHMVAYDLRKYIDAHPILGRHVRLCDQSQNREAAREASYFGVDATVDLSSASDRVSWAVVRRCFAGTSLLPWLYATRSRDVQLPNQPELVTTLKFAPMGSDLCFPIETLIFSAACEVAAQESGRKPFQTHWRAYGDDLIFPSALVPKLIEVLESMRFVVNHDKTFTREVVRSFRESCGGEYLGGEDVTPLRISRRFQGGSLLNKEGRIHPHSATMFEGLIELANAFFDKGFLNCRRWIIQRLLDLPPSLRPPFGDQPGQLHSYSPCDNYHVKSRWNPRLQRREFKCGCVQVPKISPPSDSYVEDVRYLEWWNRAARNPDPVDVYGVNCRETAHVGSYGTPRLVSRWIPGDG